MGDAQRTLEEQGGREQGCQPGLWGVQVGLGLLLGPCFHVPEELNSDLDGDNSPTECIIHIAISLS